MTAANLIPSIRPRFNAPPLGGDYGAARAMVWAFLYLVALGSGGIKPCVSSFGGDQFDDGSARERKWRSSFFVSDSRRVDGRTGRAGGRCGTHSPATPPPFPILSIT